jgi:hypothetical protein
MAGAGCNSGIHPYQLGKFLADERKKANDEKAAKDLQEQERQAFLAEYGQLKATVRELEKRMEMQSRQMEQMQRIAPVQYVQQPVLKSP